MAGGKRKRGGSAKEKLQDLRKSLEDTETLKAKDDLQIVEESEDENEDESDDNDSDESSVYSELEREEAEEESDEDASDSDGDASENDAEDRNKEGPADAKKDEYEYDSSDEEDIRNTIGNIPINWYDEYDHLGYNLDGKQIRKPKRGDELDHFLSKMDDPNFGVTVRDPTTGQDVVLSDKDVETIKRLRGAKVPDADYSFYEDWVDFYSSQTMDVPLRDVPAHKRSFLPSMDEKRKVSKMVHAIKMGWMKPRTEKKAYDPMDEARRSFYMLWKTDDQPEEMKRIKDIIPAPKMRLPGHAESYNPPPEYLMTDKEKEEWNEQEEEPYKRKYNFIPQKFNSLRNVPGFKNFISERFERCLDLYLAPRARKERLTIQPEDLVPQLPDPKDLQPFPQVCAMTYKGHKNKIRSLTIELPKGQFFASGCDDGTVRIWEVQTGYCHKLFNFGSNVVVHCVAWCPNPSLALLAVAVEDRVVLLNTGVGDKVVVDQTNELLGDEEHSANDDYIVPDRVAAAVTWQTPEAGRAEANANTPQILVPSEALVVLNVFKQVKQVTWHAKGDYFATVCPEGLNRSVLIHQLSKRRSQIPFSKAKGLVQCVMFHPIRPYLFVATQRHVRIYNLMKQELTKKLMTGSKWISSLAIHPQGDNVLVGTFDKRVQWFDLDLSTSPYQVLRYHLNAVRSVAYHRRYPLFASCSDDNAIIVSHGMVYNDLLQNPLIVPVKFLRGHTNYDGFGCMHVMWHPTQPWLLSAGADGHVKLWT